MATIGFPILMFAVVCAIVGTISDLRSLFVGSKHERQLEKHVKRLEQDLEIERRHQQLTAAHQLQTRRTAPFPTGENNWVDYAQRNPAVTLNMMEKVQIDEGHFEAERHMKMSGTIPFSERPRPFFTPAGCDYRKNEARERERWERLNAPPVVGPEAFGGGTRIS